MGKWLQGKAPAAEEISTCWHKVSLRRTLASIRQDKSISAERSWLRENKHALRATAILS